MGTRLVKKKKKKSVINVPVWVLSMVVSDASVEEISASV